MKLSVSLSEEDVATLDEHVARAGLSSRSAGIQQAVRLLREKDLAQDYAQAWDEWVVDGGAQEWESTAGDGLGNAAR